MTTALGAAGALTAALVLSGCGLLGPAPAPRPVQAAPPLSLELETKSAERRLPERLLAVARSVQGVYVRVLMVDDREVGAGRDAPREAGVVTGASGAIVDRRGYVVTAAHVATSAALKARVITADGVSRPGAVVAIAPQRELALLRIAPYPGMAVARLGASGGVRAGEPVFSIGTPDNRRGVLFAGEVANPRRAQRIQYGAYGYDDAVELKLGAEPGLSGGPLFNGEGELIGIVASFSLGNTNPDEYGPTRLGWAVPAAAISAYLREVAGR